MEWGAQSAFFQNLTAVTELRCSEIVCELKEMKGWAFRQYGICTRFTPCEGCPATIT